MTNKQAKYIIYMEGDKIKGTRAENYYSRIQDAFKIRTFDGFNSLQQAKEYMVKYGKLTDEEVETIEKEEK